MRGTLLLWPAVALVALAAACGGSDDASAEEEGEGPLVVLFLVQAEGGTLAPGAEDGSYRLELTGTDHRVVGFTDGPRRSSNSASLDQFLELWAESDFPEEPPNAALAAETGNGRSDVVALTLERPEWDEEAGVLAFDATLLEDITTGDPGVYTARGDGVVPTEFGRAQLFIG